MPNVHYPMQPVLLSGVFTNVPAGVDQGPDSGAAFVNIYRQPIWVDELRFTWDDVIAAGPTFPFVSNNGDVIRAQVYYGREPLTAGFVPVNLLCRQIDPQVNAPPLAGNTTATTSWIWKLPAPLYLPENARLDIQIQNQNDFVNAAALSGFTLNGPPPATTVRVNLVGRFARQHPGDVIDVPYAAKFLGQIFGSTNGGGDSGQEPPSTEQSGPTDLVNPFNVPLAIERFIFTIGTTGRDANFRFIPTDGVSAQGAFSAGLDKRYVRMRFSTHDGLSIVNDYMPIGAVFANCDRSWEVNSVLIPQGYYVADLIEEEPIIAAFAVADSVFFLGRVSLSFQDSRKVPLAQILGAGA